MVNFTEEMKGSFYIHYILGLYASLTMQADSSSLFPQM